MLTPQNSVLANITERLAALGIFERVGAFPDDVEKMGTRLPAALVADGDQQDYQQLPGYKLQFTWLLDVWLYEDESTKRAQVLNKLSGAVIAAMLQPGLGALSVEPLGVEKGEATAAPPDFHTPGVYHHLTVQRVRFALLLTDTRS